MKRLLIFSLLFILFSFTYADATLIGVNAGPRPDIIVNTGAKIEYKASEKLLTYTGEDLKITYKDGSREFLSGNDYKTSFILKIYVDNTGKFFGGVAGNDMIEWVSEGSVKIKGETYSTDTIILSGEVKAFGWANLAPDSTPKFDFLFDKNTLSGALTTQTAPPDLPWSKNYDSAMIATGEAGKTIDWTKDFTITKMKADKFPLVPEPGTLILLGSGLVGVAGYTKLRLSRRKK